MADDRPTFRLAAIDGTVYEVELPVVKAVDAFADEGDRVVRPGTNRKDRHRLPGAWRPAAPLEPGGPIVPPEPLVLAPPPEPDYHKEL